MAANNRTMHIGAMVAKETPQKEKPIVVVNSIKQGISVNSLRRCRGATQLAGPRRGLTQSSYKAKQPTWNEEKN